MRATTGTVAASRRRSGGGGGAVPVFAAAGTAGSANATSVSMPMPASIAAGNLLVIVLTVYPTAGSVRPAVTTPAGWTRFVDHADFDFSPRGGACAYWKTAVGGETALTIAADMSAHWHGVCLRYTGAHATTPINAVTNATIASGLTTQPTPTVTSTVANTLIVSWVAIVPNGSNSFTPPTGFTERFDDWYSGRNNSQGVGDKAQAAAGGSGGTHDWLSTINSSQPGRGVTFALTPA